MCLSEHGISELRFQDNLKFPNKSILNVLTTVYNGTFLRLYVYSNRFSYNFGTDRSILTKFLQYLS